MGERERAEKWCGANSQTFDRVGDLFPISPTPHSPSSTCSLPIKTFTSHDTTSCAFNPSCTKPSNPSVHSPHTHYKRVTSPSRSCMSPYTSRKMPPSPQNVPLPVSPVAGVKRPAPSLLPAFEPFSSSPALPRPMKRLAHASPAKLGITERQYPTPIPSSTTIVPSSSPPQAPRTRNPALARAFSAVSERTPLATVPSIELSEHGEPTLMGRSSNASHYQLSTNKLISRIHVSAVYTPSNPPAPKKVQVECRGWNGVKVHCQGKAFELMKGDTFTSETEDADIMVDVQDARVLLTWPKHENKISTPTDSDSTYSTWDSENSPQRNATAAARNRPLDTSPLRQQHRLQSPVSPSPATQAVHAQPSGHFSSNPPIPVPVQVYEDEPSDEEKANSAVGNTQATQSTQVASQPFALLASPNPNDFSDDNDEENDPIISSFGPYGANIGARMELFTTKASPNRQPLDPLKEASISPQRSYQADLSPKRRRHNAHRDVSDSVYRGDEAGNAIAHHIINQLAYSRLQSTPLSTLMQNLPAALKLPSLTDDALKAVLDGTRCIGTVEREGKDAAGKRLESEYYYIPEADADGSRREVIEGMGGRGLRNCRKSHKVSECKISNS